MRGVFVLLALVAVAAVPTSLHKLQRRMTRGTGALEQSVSEGTNAWVEAQLVDAVDVDVDASDVIEADADTAETVKAVRTDAETDASIGAMVLHPITVTVAGTGINAACQITVNDAAANTIDAAWLNPLRSCAALKLALNVVDDLPALDATWVPTVTRTNPTRWAAVTSGAKSVWNWSAGWILPNFQHANQNAAFNAVFTLGIAATDVLTAQFAALAIVSGVFANPTPANPNHVARSCLVVPQATGPTLTNAVVNNCAAVLRARAAMAAIVYTYSHADTTAQVPVTALNGAINGAVSITISQPAAVDVLKNVNGAAQVTVHTWVRRALAAQFDAALVGAVNAHPNMGAHTAIVGGAAVATHAVCANTGGNIVQWNNANSLNPDNLVQIEYWAGGAMLSANYGTAVGAANWFADVLVGDAVNPVVGTPAQDFAVVPNIDNRKVDVAGAASHEVFYINAASGHMTTAHGATQLAARNAAEAALVASSGVANHAMDPDTLYTTLREGGLAPVAGPSRTLKLALANAANAATGVRAHFGFAFFVLNVRVVPRTLAYNTNDMLPSKKIGWLGFADNLPLGPSDVNGNAANNGAGVHTGAHGAGVHTEQRILEQLRRFILKLETAVGGGNGFRLKVTHARSRWVTDFTPDDAVFNNCFYAIKFVGAAANRGYFRTAQYTEAIRSHSDPTVAAGVGGYWDLATLNAQLGGAAPLNRIDWSEPVIHFVYMRWPNHLAVHGARLQFERRRGAVNAAGGGNSIPNAAQELAWGNPDGLGTGGLEVVGYFVLA
jgi:hypothetical protein